jgi:hypothetical protein
MRPPHLRSFRKSLTWSGVILFGLAVAARATAKVSMPQVPDSSNNEFNVVLAVSGRAQL